MRSGTGARDAARGPARDRQVGAARRLRGPGRRLRRLRRARQVRPDPRAALLGLRRGVHRPRRAAADRERGPARRTGARGSTPRSAGSRASSASWSPTLELVIGRAAAGRRSSSRTRPATACTSALARFLSAFCEDQQPAGLGPRRSALGRSQQPRAARGADRRRAPRRAADPRQLPRGPDRARSATRSGERPGFVLRELIDALADDHRVRVTRLRPLSARRGRAAARRHPHAARAELRTLAADRRAQDRQQPAVHPPAPDQPRRARPAARDRARVDLGRAGDPAAEIPDDAARGHGRQARTVCRTTPASCSPGRPVSARALTSPRSRSSAARPQAELTPILYDLVDTGLLTVVGREYRFAHDRIQDAAIARLAADLRRRLHWRVGRHLLTSAGDDEHGERLFDVVDHLDAALDPESVPRARRAARARVSSTSALARGRSTPRPTTPRCATSTVASRCVEDRVPTSPSSASEPTHYELRRSGSRLPRPGAGAVGAQRAGPRGVRRLLGWRLGLSYYGRVAARRIRLLSLADQPGRAVELGLDALASLWLSPGQRALAAHVRTWRLVRAWLTLARARHRRSSGPCPTAGTSAIGAAMEIATATKNAAYVIQPKLVRCC